MALIAVVIVGIALTMILIYKIGGVKSESFLVFFSSKNRKSASKKLTVDERNRIAKLYFATIFRLLGYIAKSDGQVEDGEHKLTNVYMKKMVLSEEERVEAIRLFKLGAEPEFQLKNVLDDFRRVAQDNSDVAKTLLAYLINLIRSGGLLTKTELDVLHEVADDLGLLSADFKRLLRMISSQNTFVSAKGNSGSNDFAHVPDAYDHDYLTVAYDAIGVTAQSNNSELRKAYEQLIDCYHPNKFRERGLPEFMIMSAVEHVKRMNVAYDYIRKCRGAI